MYQEKYEHMAQYWFFSNLVQAKGGQNPILTLFMKQLMLSTAFPPAELRIAI